MYRFVSTCLLLASLSGFLSTSGNAAEPSPSIPVGAARVDITPDGPIRLSGYLARSKETAVVEQKLWAKALAIGGAQAGTKPSILVSVDNVGVPDTVVTAVAQRLEAEEGIGRGQFALASSHTHSGPCLSGALPNIFGKKIEAKEQTSIDAYTQVLTEKLVQVCRDALRNRKPARLAWSKGTVGFAANRRTKGGPVDHDLPVLRVTNEAGKPLAFVVNYACHCTTLDPADNAISGDWAGYAQEAIEKDQPGAIAMTVIGCGADSNPLRRLQRGAAHDHGRAIAGEVKRLLEGSWKPLNKAPTGKFERLPLELGPIPNRAELLATIKKGGPAGYAASVQLERLDRGEGLQITIDYAIQTWTFGDDLAMVFLAGEVVVDYSLRLKQELDPARLWVTAYANDVPAYIPSERILKEGGYEAGGAMIYYGRTAPFLSGLEDKIVAVVKSQLPGAFQKKRSPEPAAGAADNDSPPALAPAEALSAFHVAPGYKVELVVAEPLVVDPVAVDFGTDGRLWVCEMRDYPMGIDGNWKPGGVIKFLEDSDADGRYDKATEFLGGLPFPTGVMAWRDGVLISSAPNILFAQDTDKDGKADRVTKLFEGFATENFQARVNGLFYGLDNWIYGANGLIGGSIKGTATGKVVNIGGRDFRIRPDSWEFEAASGLTQQGRVQDDWGNQFGGNNSVLLQQYPFPDHYARRNPRVASPGPTVLVPRGPDNTRIFPTSRTLTRFNEPQSANHVTSACGPLIFRDDLLGEAVYGNGFTCEPVHNLVHREVLTPDGVTFAGRRAAGEESSEFLSSTDSWFRPVQVRTGPDGALWVVDMYRFLIEHPRWIDPARLATIDARAGADKGRIYRVVPIDRSARPVPILDRLAGSDLAKQLNSPSGTLRDMTQRLLVERGEKSAVPTLIDLARKAMRPQTRLQALCTLEGLGELPADLIRSAIDDPHPGVRRQAIRLAEPWLDRDQSMGPAAVKHVADRDPAVRFQLALSLGAWDAPEAGRALARLALKEPVDPWILAAVLSSATSQADRILAEALESPGSSANRMKLVVPLIATMAGQKDPTRLRSAVAPLIRPRSGGGYEPWQIAAIVRLFDSGIGGAAFPDGLPDAILEQARSVVESSKANETDRLAAIGLLGRTEREHDRDRTIIDRLVVSDWPVAGQPALAGTILRLGAADALEMINEHWSHCSPGLRTAILDAFGARPESMSVILDAVATLTITPAEIDASFRERFTRHPDPAIRERAGKLLFATTARDRGQVIQRYRSASAAPGDPKRGRAVFSKTCASCHRMGGEGNEVGPDLTALTETSPESFLTAILDPNRDVDARYASYVAALSDGRVLNGLIASETANAITLKRQGGILDVILRSDIEALKTTGQTLMPEGLENDIPPSAMSDLIAYLQTRGMQPKTLAGNQPRTVKQGTDRAVRLTAAEAEIYGPSLIFEADHQNLGHWQKEEDSAEWTFSVEHAGVYTVSMEWDCPEESAGNRFVYQCGKQSRICTVGATGNGTWSNYRTIFLGELKLEPGIHRIALRPVGEIRGALMDLRRVLLTPRIALQSPGR